MQWIYFSILKLHDANTVARDGLIGVIGSRGLIGKWRFDSKVEEF